MSDTPNAPARGRPMTHRFLRALALALGLTAAVSPASAQWELVADIPATNAFSVRTFGDTIVVARSVFTYVSTDGGHTWLPSTLPAVGVPPLRTVLLRDGRLYVGSSGQGVFVSDDLGQTWAPYNQGLVGGFQDSQLDVSDLQVRGDSLYAATVGAGVYLRTLAGAGTWQPFSGTLEGNQAANVFSLSVGGHRLLAGAGGNGSVFFRDPGDADWTQSWLDNAGIRAGLQASAALWAGTGWVVGANAGRGVFSSQGGQEPWTFVNVGLGPLISAAFASRGPHLYASFNAVIGGVGVAAIEQSDDDGLTWQMLELLPGAFVYQMAVSGTTLYAARADGLWRRSLLTASVPPAASGGALRFLVAGTQPVSRDVRFRVVLPEPGVATIDVFDAAGRRAAGAIRQAWPAGAHEFAWDAGALAPGVYHARLTAAGQSATLRLVRLR